MLPRHRSRRDTRLLRHLYYLHPTWTWDGNSSNAGRQPGQLSSPKTDHERDMKAGTRQNHTHVLPASPTKTTTLSQRQHRQSRPRQPCDQADSGAARRPKLGRVGGSGQRQAARPLPLERPCHPAPILVVYASWSVCRKTPPRSCPEGLESGARPWWCRWWLTSSGSVRVSRNSRSMRNWTNESTLEAIQP